ncbi:MAG: hypothetical protein IAG13_11310 [Deltaproteobacteria bacterium]|nr:hypothetical protein [Nannocystaceae bacterium]
MHSHPWFERLFGFPEGDWVSTQRAFVLEGSRLRSLASGRTFGVGAFTTPSLCLEFAGPEVVPEDGVCRP